jgi:hypothetical protein
MGSGTPAAVKPAFPMWTVFVETKSLPRSGTASSMVPRSHSLVNAGPPFLVFTPLSNKLPAFRHHQQQGEVEGGGCNGSEGDDDHKVHVVTGPQINETPQSELAGPVFRWLPGTPLFSHTLMGYATEIVNDGSIIRGRQSSGEGCIACLPTEPS